MDIEAGRIAPVRCLVVEDCGRPANPMVAEGRVHGAVADVLAPLGVKGTGLPLSPGRVVGLAAAGGGRSAG